MFRVKSVGVWLLSTKFTAFSVALMRLLLYASFLNSINLLALHSIFFIYSLSSFFFFLNKKKKQEEEIKDLVLYNNG